MTSSHGKVKVVHLATRVCLERCADLDYLDGREGVSALEMSACDAGTHVHESADSQHDCAEHYDAPCNATLRPTTAFFCLPAYPHLIHERQHLGLVELAGERAVNNAHRDVVDWCILVAREDGGRRVRWS